MEDGVSRSFEQVSLIDEMTLSSATTAVDCCDFPFGESTSEWRESIHLYAVVDVHIW